MPSGGPAGGGIKGAWDYGSELVGADGGRSVGWLGVVDDDRRSFGTKSLSRGVPQLWVCRHRTLSFSRMRRIWLRLTRMPALLAASASGSKLHQADSSSNPATIVPYLCVTSQAAMAWRGMSWSTFLTFLLTRILVPQPCLYPLASSH